MQGGGWVFPSQQPQLKPMIALKRGDRAGLAIVDLACIKVVWYFL